MNGISTRSIMRLSPSPVTVKVTADFVAGRDLLALITPSINTFRLPVDRGDDDHARDDRIEVAAGSISLSRLSSCRP